MKKPRSQADEPKTMLGMPPMSHPGTDHLVTGPTTRSEEPKTAINTSSSLRIAMRMRAQAVESREPPRPTPRPAQAAPTAAPQPRPARPAPAATVLVPPEFVQRQRRAGQQPPSQASRARFTPLPRTQTSIVRRVSGGLVTAVAGVVLIWILVLRPDMDPTGAATIIHDAAFGPAQSPPAAVDNRGRAAAPRALSSTTPPNPARPLVPQASGAQKPTGEPPRGENAFRRLKDAPPLPSSSRPGAAAAPPELAVLEKQAVEMLIANQFEAARAAYAKLLSAAPSHREYEVMLRLLAAKLRTESK